ncbi:cadherin domain-containing protein, partial [Bradyrhizobium sp. cf659]|uniref:cadherin domain-containing protein n=1 Tax=Bradyrhizobium sp. cf659 TaxID=1761771 RepID=UPI001160D09A
VKVTATDNTTDAFAVETTINVAVTDVNEQPALTSGGTGTVAENAPVSTIIYDASASDPDTTAPNNVLTYSLGGTDAGAFNIDGATGEVTLKASADYEVKNAYHVNVTVTDGGGLFDTKAVTINVTDVNEAPTAPVDSDNTVNSVNAHATNGTSVGLTAHSTDPDAGDSVTYQITGGTGASLFSVNANGIVTVADAANLNAGSYTLLIDAVDSHGAASSSSSFAINALQADLGGPTGINFVVSSMGVLGTADNGNSLNSGADLGKFVATGDPDAIDTFHFALTGSDAAKFSIDPNTGELFVGGSNLTAQTAANGDDVPYHLTVTATDQANNTTQTSVDVWVGVATKDTMIGGSGVDIMFGMNGNDALTGNGGSDALLGGPNADTIYGGGGADQLIGGDGKDNFLYKFAAESSNTTIGHDAIYNFTAGGSSQDTIDFTQLGAVGSDITTYQAPLSGAGVNLNAHSVAWIESGGNTIVYANTSNAAEDQGHADMMIVLAGTNLGLTASNFLLHP